METNLLILALVVVNVLFLLLFIRERMGNIKHQNDLIYEKKLLETLSEVIINKIEEAEKMPDRLDENKKCKCNGKHIQSYGHRKV